VVIRSAPRTAQWRRDIGAEHQREGEGERMALAVASAITNSTIVRLECISQVSATATKKPRNGSPARPPSSEPKSCECSKRRGRDLNWISDSSISPKPMAMRPMPWPCRLRRA